MKAVIRQRALELGFDDCRFTTASAPASAGKFQDWLAQKNHGEMQWLERNAEKRVEPQNVLAGAKSMIVLAASYASFRSSRREEALINGEFSSATRVQTFCQPRRPRRPQAQFQAQSVAPTQLRKARRP